MGAFYISKIRQSGTKIYSKLNVEKYWRPGWKFIFCSMVIISIYLVSILKTSRNSFLIMFML